MSRGMKVAALVATVACASVASADSVFLDYYGVEGGNSVSISGVGSFTAGHMRHRVYNNLAGDTLLGTFNTFCIELQNTSQGDISEYQIVDITDAPDPDLGGSPTSYTQAQADAVIDVVSKAIELGWIDINLQNAGGTSAQITAIQGAIWQALDFGAASSSNGDVSAALTAIANEDVEAGIRNLMANRLVAAVADGEQDMLYIVPLPTAAWAGLGLLGVCAGVRQVRRRS